MNLFMHLEKNSNQCNFEENKGLPMTNYDAEEVKKIASEILKHKQLYYSGNAKISDVEFDKLEDRLRSIAPNHPVLSMVGFDNPGASSSKVEHKVPMLSLAKTYVPEDVLAWMGERPIVGTYKIDGNSLSLIYENGKLVLGKTRGNGRVGENVTDKTSWVADCVPTLGSSVNYEIRGELYCSDTSFLELAKKMSEKGLEKPTNPRNIVAGILGRKSHLDLATYFNFFAFDVLDESGSSPFESEVEKFKWLEEHGFLVPPYKKLKSEKEITAFLEEARIYMDEGDVGIDGVVFAYDEVALHKELGATAHHPRFKLSFKWAGETAQATIKEITWATSRLGIVTPVAVVEPVYLSGANITNITLHNAAHVLAYNLKKGDVIEIIRSGEVIPKFLSVVSEGNGKLALPEKCNSCNETLVQDEVRLYCPNSSDCPAQRIGGILNWIKAAQIDDLSEKRLTAMIDLNLVEEPSSLYSLTLQDLLSLPLTKEKMALKLMDNIRKSKEIPLSHFLTGLGISGTGRNTWELILNKYPTLDEVRKLTVEQIVEIKGFAEKLANQIVSGLISKSSTIENLLKAGVKPQDFIPVDTSDLVFDGMSFVITGTLSRPRAEIQKDIKNLGGSVGSAVSKNTDVLVTNDPESNSSKAKKARELGIKIWTELELSNQMNR